MSAKRGMPTVLALVVTLALAGCAGVSVQDYAGKQPALVMEQFFTGPLVAHGVVKDRGGRVTRSFSADLVGSWHAGVGTLEEDFVFDDGEIDRRVWTLTPVAPGRYVGTAGDVVGEAAVEVAGNAVFLDYVLRIPYGDDTVDVAIDDRMYLVAPGVLINESVLTKFGLRVGELLLVIEKRASEPSSKSEVAPAT